MPDGWYRFYTTDVFTDRPFGGNPLAVFPDGRGLSTEEMQRVTREFNLSETVFVLPPQDTQHTRQLRIFTPGRELPFAGHPTVGTAVVLATIGEIACPSPQTSVIFEEGVGPIPVTIRTAADRPTHAQFAVAQLPEFGPPAPPAADIAEVLSLTVEDLQLAGASIRAASCGIPFLYVPIKDRAGVERARLNLPAWERVLQAYWAPQLFIFSHETVTPDADVHARMFSPTMGVMEDPATGSAASSLAGILAPTAAQSSGTVRWLVEQGFEMQRPSFLEVEADLHNGAITAVRVGGQAVMISQGEMRMR